MAARARKVYLSVGTLGVIYEQLSSATTGLGKFYDASDGTFKTTPVTPVTALTLASTGTPFATSGTTSVYYLTLPDASTASNVWTNGDYVAYIVDTSSGSNVPVDAVAFTMNGGDDATVFPSGAGADPWSTPLPGAYSAGTAGFLVGTNLDARVSLRLPTTTYTQPPSLLSIINGVWDEGRLSHLTTNSFGASITTLLNEGGGGGGFVDPAPADFLDDIIIDTGINARQALWYILAHAAGDTSGASPTSSRVTFKSPTSGTTAIVKDCDPNGNRTGVSLSNPPDVTP